MMKKISILVQKSNMYPHENAYVSKNKPRQINFLLVYKDLASRHFLTTNNFLPCVRAVFIYGNDGILQPCPNVTNTISIFL